MPECLFSAIEYNKTGYCDQICVTVPCQMLNLNVLFIFVLNWLQIKHNMTLFQTEQLGKYRPGQSQKMKISCIFANGEITHRRRVHRAVSPRFHRKSIGCMVIFSLPGAAARPQPIPYSPLRASAGIPSFWRRPDLLQSNPAAAVEPSRRKERRRSVFALQSFVIFSGLGRSANLFHIDVLMSTPQFTPK